MREGYGSHSVCLSVCLSVTELAATYLDYTLKFGCHWAERYADHLWLLSFWMNSRWTKEAAMASFRED